MRRRSRPWTTAPVSDVAKDVLNATDILAEGGRIAPLDCTTMAEVRQGVDALDRALIDLATYFRDALLVSSGAGAIQANHPDMSEKVAAMKGVSSEFKVVAVVHQKVPAMTSHSPLDG